jgi:hypothetical protein
MKVRVFDSDGVYRGGLFKTHAFTAMNCRYWHAPPHPTYTEHLVDIAGLSKPCRRDSWFLLRLAKTPELSGPPDGRDNFDAASQAFRIKPEEALTWFQRNGFEPPTDLVRLLDRPKMRRLKRPAREPAETDLFAPYMPASCTRLLCR